MTNIIETPAWEESVYEIQKTDAVLGGTGGIANLASAQLANRTSWLKQQIDNLLSVTLPLYAAIKSPVFTGVPKAPTADLDTNTTQLATTEFVLNQAGDTAPVVNGNVTPGTSERYSRADHVHPVDLTRAPVTAPAFKGDASVEGALTVGGKITATGSINSTDVVTRRLEVGTTTDTGYIDLHRVGGNSDYDIRITAASGSADTIGAGKLNVSATGGVALNGPLSGTSSSMSGDASVGGALSVIGAALLGALATFKKALAVWSQGASASVSFLDATGATVQYALQHDDTSGRLYTYPSAGGSVAAMTFARATGAITLAAPLTTSSDASVGGALSVTGASTLTGDVTAKGALNVTKGITTALGVTANAANIATVVELGSTTSTGFIDFHYSGGNTDYDVRMQATAGVSGTTGAGTLGIYAAGGVNINSKLTVTGNVGGAGGYTYLAANMLGMTCTDTTNASNMHMWFWNYDGTERGLMYWDSAGGFHLRSKGAADSLTISAAGETVIKGNIISAAGLRARGGQVYAGSESGTYAYLNYDGNIYSTNLFGSQGAGWLSNWIAANYVNRANMGSDTVNYIAAGGVGSYALLLCGGGSSSVNVTIGNTIPGASSYYCSASTIDSVNRPTGTWRVMGFVTDANADATNSITLCQRIA